MANFPKIKKKHLRRMTFLWLMLVFCEMFCPVFCDDYSNLSEVGNSLQVVVEQVSQSSISVNESQTDNQKSVCNDECLCHATPLPMIAFAFPKFSDFNSESTLFIFKEPITQTLSPPIQPPQLS